MINQDVIDRAMEWLVVGDTGLSSINILSHTLSKGKTLNLKFTDAKFHPRDPSDLKRCVHLLDKVPELRESLYIMRNVSRYWEALIDRWDELEGSLKAEMASNPEAAPETYKLMKSILSQVMDREYTN